MSVDASEVASRLASRVESVCAWLLPGGKKVGHEWVDDPGTGKIKVSLHGAKVGVWGHFGGDGGGDLLDLVAYVKTNRDRSAAFREACAWLGIENPFANRKPAKSYQRPQRPQASQPAVKGTKVDEYLRCTRGLYPETLQAFKVMEASEMTGTRDDGSEYRVKGPWVLFPYFRPEPGPDGRPVLANIKWLHVERDQAGKKRTKQESNAQPTLFGWQAAHPAAKACCLTEGEVDCATVHQWQVTYQGQPVTVLSLPQGAGTGAKQNWIESDYDALAHFEVIFLWMDGDEEGQKTIPELVQRLGVHRCRIIQSHGLPGKDANECYAKHGMTGLQAQALFDSAPFLDPAELKRAGVFLDDVIQEFYPQDEMVTGIPLPWPSANWLRLRPGEVTLWTGTNGSGKTSSISQVLLHAADRGTRVCIFSGEVAAKKTLAKMVRQVAMMERPTVGYITDIMAWLDERVWIIDRKGKIDRARLLDHFRYARRRWGVGLFVIDSFMKLGIPLEDYQAQSDYAEDVTAFNDSEGCHTIVVAHPSKPKDDTKPVGRFAIKGSGDLSDKVHLCLETHRNRSKEKAIRDINKSTKFSHEEKVSKLADQHNRPDNLLICDKNRYDGREGAVDLWFNAEAECWADNARCDLPVLSQAPLPPRDEDMPF